jgi:hypothetical protein
MDAGRRAHLECDRNIDRTTDPCDLDASGVGSGREGTRIRTSLKPAQLGKSSFFISGAVDVCPPGLACVESTAKSR